MQYNRGGEVINRRGRFAPVKDKVNVNEKIRAREVRAIDEEGNQLGVIPLSKALEEAREKGLDLVEVASNADPPVCKIMDYGKYKYEMSKKAHEAKKKQAVVIVKEMKMRPKIDEHDYQFKMKHVRKFLSEGSKVKLSIMFRGREMMYMDRGRKILDRVAEDVSEEAKVEFLPKVEGRNMFMILSPVKTDKNK